MRYMFLLFAVINIVGAALNFYYYAHPLNLSVGVFNTLVAMWMWHGFVTANA
jgi:hypothetical protein